MHLAASRGLYTTSYDIQPGLLGRIQVVCAGGEVADIADFVVDIRQVEVDEICDLRLLLHDAGGGVHEQRSGQRIIAAVHGRIVGFHALDGENLQGVGVLGVVSIAEVTDGVGAAQNTPDEHIVVLTELLILGAERFLSILVEDLFHEEIEGAGIGAGNEALDRLARPTGIHIRPQFCVTREQQGQFIEGGAFDEVVLIAYDHSQSVGANPNLDRFPTNGLAIGDFFVLDRTAGVGDIRFARHAEALETCTGADAVDGDVVGVAFISKAFGHALGKREHGRAASDDDVA